MMIRKVNKSTLEAVIATVNAVHSQLYCHGWCSEDGEGLDKYGHCKHDNLLDTLKQLTQELSDQADKNAATKTSVYALK